MFKKIMLVVLVIALSPISFAKSTIEALYLVSAPTAQVIKSSENHYQLVLTQARVDYFSDRPARAAGQITVERFIQQWTSGDNNFVKDNPNAALVAGFDSTKVGGQVREFIILDHPFYNKKTQQLMFDVKALQSRTHLVPGHFSAVALFIDMSALSVGCSAGDYGPGCV